MMSVEMGGGVRGGGTVAGGGSAAAGGGNIDPSNLHLKRELSQIRKAARVLRDPGTSSSWRSPINSARSLTKHHYVHHHKSGQLDGNEIVSSSEQFLYSNANNLGTGIAVASDKVNVSAKEREKRVFLHNWRSQKSEGEKSKQILDGDDEDESNSKEEGSFSTSVDVDSLSDARNNGGGNDSKSDAYLSEKYNTSDIFRCKDTNFTPSIMRTIKKKSKRNNYYSSASLRHHNEKLKKQIVLSRCAKNDVEGLGRDDLVSLVDQSDDTEDYLNSEDLRSRASAISPLLARFKYKSGADLSTKMLTNRHLKEDDSISYSTPALSTSSRHKYVVRNPSTIVSWDATTASFNDADDEVDDKLDLPGRHGCGIPCYWSKRSTPKSRVGYGSCCSPSLSDTLRRKGSSIFCGAQSIHQRRRHRRPSTRIPLLTDNGRGGSSSISSSGNSEDELGELDLEGLSRLDGRRWSSSCRSQEGLEMVALNGDVHDEGSPENVRSLSHKYRPMFFEELIGQNLVVQSLKSAILRKRVAPVYLFQGPRGTGKTSMARIFSAALNCLAAEENNNNNNKPCGVCRECADFVSGKSNHIREVDGSKIEKIKNLLKSLSTTVRVSAISQFEVFVVDECHLLPSKTWLSFLRLLEKPLPHVVFVFITTDVDNVPRTILSRCQKHLFNNISNVEIVARLRKIGDDENLDVDCDALEMIASNADGSLRDAETMLDQLSLFGKRISVALVNELIGVVSDEKLLELLELAMSSNATETVIRARELMDLGVDPTVLMSQMATLIVDIIAGTYLSVDGKHNSFLGGRNLSERELDRLKHALTLLSDAEKHLRVSSERSTWFTATLLQLGSLPSSDRTHSGSSRRLSSKATEDDHMSMKSARRNSTSKDDHVSINDNNDGFNSNPSRSQFQGDEPSVVSKDDGKSGLRCVNSKMLTNVWVQCIEKCHSKTLRQLLHSHGRLVSISEVNSGFVAHIGFVDKNIKTRAEGFLSSITNSFEIVLRHNVEVRTILLPDSLRHKQTDKNTEDHPIEPFEPAAKNPHASSSKGTKSEVPMKRIESIIHEQRLETAWLQAMDRGTPRSTSRLKPERNQVLPQDGANEFGPSDSVEEHWEDELNCEIKALKVDDRVVTHKDDQIVAKRIDHYPISPSILHNSSFESNFSRDNMGYESGPGGAGCGGMFCWNNSRPERSRKLNPFDTMVQNQAKQGSLRGHKSGRFSCFGECAKSKGGNRYNR